MNPASDQPMNELINISVQNGEQVTRLLRLMSVKSTNKTVIFFLMLPLETIKLFSFDIFILKIKRLFHSYLYNIHI